MIEQLSTFFNKTEKKYSLPDKNIIALGEDSEIRQKNKAYREGLQKNGIEWPIENQGGGPTDPEKKEFTIAYPKGDVFASWAITIHELGHLRQAERHGKVDFDEIQDTIDTETDAWEKGWERVNTFQPKTLEYLENKFQKEKQIGKLKQFVDFNNYFNYIKKMFIACSQAHHKLPEDTDTYSEEAGHLLAKEIKTDPDLWKFYTKQEYWKVEKIIDQEKVENFIKKIAENIADEKY